VTGALGGDIVSCTGIASFATATVGADKTVSVSGLTLTGTGAGNYALSVATATTTAAITAAVVAPAITAANKIYDGTTAATLASCIVTGTFGDDAVACTGTAAFDTATVGVGKTVTATGLTLIGAAAGNYLLSSPTATTTADITAMVTPVITAANKVYDGTTAATITSCELTGVADGDEVACTGTAAFDTASVGSGKTVTATGLTLTGSGAASYALSSTTATTTAAITAAAITPAITAANKTYDRTTAATLTGCTVTGVVAGDVVACAAATAAFDTFTVGTGKRVTASGLTLSGPAAANYVLAPTMTTTIAAITAVMVTPAVTAADKIYDGTKTATLTTCVITNAVAGDEVACTGTAEFDTSTAGSGKTVTATGLTLIGPAAGNYVLSSTTATTTATITSPDIAAPTISFTTPASTGTYASVYEPLAVSGIAADNIAVSEVRWTTSRGASGIATGTTTWSMAAVPLGGGTTVITVTARDAANNTSHATLTVTYVPPAAVTLISPSGTIATARPSFRWEGVAGATHYELRVIDANGQERINATFTAAAAGCGTAPGTCSISPDVTLPPGGTTWWIRPSNGAGAGPSGSGFTFTVPIVTDFTFTDHPLTPGTMIKLVHIQELRTAINTVRARKGIAPFVFTDATLVAGSTVMKTVHITELRVALAGAYTAAGRPLPTYTDPVLTPGMAPKVAHISEIRAAVSNLP
jgi:hypothetical protein